MSLGLKMRDSVNWLASLFYPLGMFAIKNLQLRRKWPVWMWRGEKPWLGSETQHHKQKLFGKQSGDGVAKDTG